MTAFQDLLLHAAATLSALALVFAFAGWLTVWRRKPRAADARTAEALERLPAQFREDLRALREDDDRQARSLREELQGALKGVGDSLDQRLSAFSATTDQRLNAFAETIKASGEALAQSQSRGLADSRQAQADELQKVRDTLSANLTELRKENQAELDKMRATVDEKLQGTLEQRLGENFKLVSERLDTVHKGLGEMQALAAGVGDLKRALTNIKARGTWGEVQLGALLDDMLTPDQFGRQVRVRGDSGEAVDYAVFLPGQTPDGQVLLPIDCKFPQEDYQRLLDAQEAGDPVQVETAAKGLERALRTQAKSIREKYVHPPATTPFAILYLPTEGLFAEVIRRPGLAAALANDFAVTVTGPTTLAALLNSLRMGFQTLAIEKRSSEVWQVLGEAKSEFLKYGAVWDKLGKQLDTARRTVDEAGKRTRAVERRLRSVEVIEAVRPADMLPLAALDLEADEDANEAAPE